MMGGGFKKSIKLLVSISVLLNHGWCYGSATSFDDPSQKLGPSLINSTIPATNSESSAISANDPEFQSFVATEATQSTMAETEITDAMLPTPTSQSDPLEKFNRVMFTFNDYLDRYLLKPVATFYNAIMPKPLNQGIHNFFLNFGEVPIIANDILQLHFYQMANDAWRFGLNSTVGILGFFDIASRMNLPYYSNDFGLTLATYGYTDSNYLVLPFFGPNTIRDGMSVPIDYFAFSLYPYVRPESFRYELYGLGAIDLRAQLLEYQSVFDEATYDKYIFTRNAYMQRRKYQIEQNTRRGFEDQVLDKPMNEPQANN